MSLQFGQCIKTHYSDLLRYGQIVLTKNHFPLSFT